MTRATAETMATKQKDIAVSEFFAKNRHLLGFDNPRKALLTTVKEAVDNCLDACEEAGTLPNILVWIEELNRTRYRVTVVDNGPGIVRKHIENVFGRLLFGSKFHRLKMSRGQQGIGISAAGMYGLLTTGKPTTVVTRTDHRKPAHLIELAMNTKTNRAEASVDEETKDFPPAKAIAVAGEFATLSDFPTGTSVSIELEGKYLRGRGSVEEFLELTAIGNPHAKIVFVTPKGYEDESSPDSTSDANTPEETTERNGVILYPRGTEEVPKEPDEIQPHPKGIELGTLLQMFQEYEPRTASLTDFLQASFSAVSAAKASEICKDAAVPTKFQISLIEPETIETIFHAMQRAKLPPPPTDCLAPIGVRQMIAGMLKGVKAEFYAASTREPEVYRGRPFQVEAAIAFGGELPTEDSARIIRFANRVPLLFKPSDCCATHGIEDTNWRKYDLQQPKNSLPQGPLVIMIHLASVWVPFTSESKEAIADYDEIRQEMRLALMECGRKLGSYLKKRAKMLREGQRRDVFKRYIAEITKAVNSISGFSEKKLGEALLQQATRKTAMADAELDEDGQTTNKPDVDPEEDGTLLVTARVKE